MKIGILSDTHNSVYGIQIALQQFHGLKIETLFHCGDMTRGDTAELFQDFELHHVWGNGDLDTIAIQFAIQECVPGSTTGQIYTGVLADKRIAALHGHDLAMLQSLIEGGHYDYVFHGHTHRKRDELIGNTRVINPGAVGGAFRSSRSFCVLDLKTGNLTDYPVE